MGKAIEGAALLGAALTGEVLAAYFNPALLFNPAFQHAMEGLALSGAGMEAGALASMLTNNAGSIATVHQAAAPRQVIYGQRRVAGTSIYESTTGSAHDQVNLVIVLAGHECHSIQALYLDGREVFFQGGGPGWAVRNGVGFGGSSRDGDHIGPGGQTYNFGDTGVYCEARYGDQTDPLGTTTGGSAGPQAPGTPSFMNALRANDGAWTPDGKGNAPWLGGCTYVYLKIVYNTNRFPSGPLQSEIKFTVNGKNNIFDPRMGTMGFTNNWALCIADKLTDTVFGLGDTNGVNQAQLIAAANVCDEQIELGIGGFENQYALNWMHDTGTSPGAALETMLAAAGGRLRNIGGEWYIFPAYWQGPSATFDLGALTSPPQWKPYRSASALVNRVNGTYIAANYPYNSNTYPSNLYDSNGWYNGSLPNTWPFAWQPSSYPQYAADPRHGYAADEWLAADGGIERPLELAQPCVVSITQAQRLAKIALLRNRQQGTGVFEMSLAAWSMQALDVMQFTFPAMGWTEKTLEIDTSNFRIEPASAGNPPSVRISFPVQETSPSIYAWSMEEELTVYDVPSNPNMRAWEPAPPTGMSLTSGAATAVIGIDGVVHPRIEVQWLTPLDVQTTQIEIQYQADPAGVAVGPWLNAPSVSATLNLGYIPDVIAGQMYNVRIRSLRSMSGAISVWEEIDGYTVSVTLSQITQLALAPGTLVGEAFSTGTAAILPGFGTGTFIAIIGNLRVVVSPANYPLAVATQGQLWWVYYIDPTFAGGAVTAIATQNQADYLNKIGYFLIDSVVTPVYVTTGGGGTGGGARYSPTGFYDTGTRTTLNPPSAFDGDITTCAAISGSAEYQVGSRNNTTDGTCVFGGFLGITLAYAAKLTIVAAFSAPSGWTMGFDITATINGNTTSIFSGTATTARATYTIAVPAGVPLNACSVSGFVLGGMTNNAGGPGGGRSDPDTTIVSQLQIFEIYIQ